MKLRPHHLLCTQSYEGKGYSNEFVKNMDKVTNVLRNEKDTKIELIFSTDDICSKCPEKIDVDLCKSNEKVKEIDSKVVKYFDLEEKEYNYEDIVKYIKKKMTIEIMDDICSKCQWYNNSNCKNIICSK